MSVIRNELPNHKIDDDLVLYDPATDRVHTLNPTARLIWEGCDGTAEIEDLVHALTTRYEISFETARTDVEQTLQQLLDMGLIRRKEPA
ncbi:MAG: HPr-rel-A system PqqD family peptide chaperone [bacterium]|nr:HPr-rel-A system PqqD family peptide chaperone [bacterium]